MALRINILTNWIFFKNKIQHVILFFVTSDISQNSKGFDPYNDSVHTYKNTETFLKYSKNTNKGHDVYLREKFKKSQIQCKRIKSNDKGTLINLTIWYVKLCWLIYSKLFIL